MKKTYSILKLLAFVILGLFLIIPSANAGGDAPPEPDANDYPIVLVHGFAGWGRNEMSVGNVTLYHWGGFTDIQEELKTNGSEVHTAEMGPFSSNWDRACELYAEIMNNPEIDYGQVHAAKFGHARFKTNPLYDPDGGNWFNGKEKIHIICHSMGASTSRMLVDLLEDGCLEEMNAGYADISPLFNASQDTTNLVHSVTTIAGINNGTTLANCISDLIPTVQELVAGIGAVAGGFDCDNPIYDFKMEQFGLERDVNEDWQTYLNRVKNSSIWDTDDVCIYDLKPTGMHEINGWVEAHPNVYYFSYTTEQTYRRVWPAPHYELPRIDMFPVLMPLGLMMGTYTDTLDYGIVINSSWWVNDGVVNTNAQKYPFLNSMDMMIEYNGTPQIGIWNHMGLLDSDHWDIMGCGFEGITGPFGTKSRLMTFYNDLESLLHDLD
jgi:triacylglycerol lipase